MKLKHKVALFASTAGLATATLIPAFASAQSVNVNADAQTRTQAQANPFTSFIQALATHFKISATELEQFFQQNLPKPPSFSDRQDSSRPGVRGQLSQVNLEAQLTSDVSAGKISATQKTVILAKIKEAQAKHEEARKLSREECKKIMDAYRTELETWLTQNGIDRSYLRLIMPRPPMGQGQMRDGSEQDHRGPRGHGMGLGIIGQGSVNGFIGGPMGQR